jgi:hypothetical protein
MAETLTDKEHAKFVVAEALLLADTGRYHDYTDIEFVLRFGYGLSDVRALLDSKNIRPAINRRCANAKEARNAMTGI